MCAPALMTLALLGCVIRGEPQPIDANSSEWKAASPLRRYAWLRNARGVPRNAGLVDGVLEDLIASAPNDVGMLLKAAEFRWWLAEGAPVGAPRSKEAQRARELARRVLALEPDSPPAHYWAALALFTEASDSGWTADLRRAFLAHLEVVLLRQPGYEEAGAFAALGRYWLAEGDAAKAAAIIDSAFTRDGSRDLGPRVFIVGLMCTLRTTPRDSQRVDFEYRRVMNSTFCVFDERLLELAKGPLDEARAFLEPAPPQR